MLTPAIADRVAETTTTTGTGTLTLAGAQTRFRSFLDGIGSGRSVEYTVVSRDANEWEVGVGTFTAPNQLTRDRVKSSSAGGALVSFVAGTKDVFVALPSQRGISAATHFLVSSF